LATSIVISFLLSPSHLLDFLSSFFSDFASPELVEGRIPTSEFKIVCAMASSMIFDCIICGK